MHYAWKDNNVTIVDGEELFDIDGNPFDPPQYTQVEQLSGTGVVTGLNRKGGEGEQTGTCSLQDLVWGMDPDAYRVLHNNFTPLGESLMAELRLSRETENAKQAAANQIREDFAVASEAPVEVTISEGTFMFNGGQDSASYIKGALDLAVALGEPDVTITDADNLPHAVSFGECQLIVITIGMIFRQLFLDKQAALTALETPAQ